MREERSINAWWGEKLERRPSRLSGQWGIYLLLALVLLSLAAAPQPQGSATYERYDVDIDIRSDGSLHIAETFQMRFEGEFHTGFAEIPLDNVSDIVDVQVREGDRAYVQGGSGPGTFTLDRASDNIYVEWEYEPTSGTEVRTFTVSYRALGGLWVYPERDMLSWTAVPEDRSGLTVEASRVTVHLPEPVAVDELGFHSYDLETRTETIDDRTVVFESLRPIPDGTPLEILVNFPHGLTRATVQSWQRRIDDARVSYRWKALSVDLTVASDGVLEVSEHHTLAVDEGYLYHGYRTIPWLYLDRIENVEVGQADQAYKFSDSPCEHCYVVEEKGSPGGWVRFDGQQVVIYEDRTGSTLVEWAFPAMGPGEETTFDLHYQVLGAVRVLTDAQEIDWTAVFADRDVPVEAADLRLHLPSGVSAEDVTVSGGATALQPDGALRVTRDGLVPPGEVWRVDVRMPAGATTAEKPAWQGELEQAIASEQRYIESQQQAAVRRARWQVALGALACLFPLVGLTGVIAIWYIWGRDKAAPPVAQYLTEPPSDLPPGIVAYLVDEKPTVKGVLADLLRLATLGLISVDLQEPDFKIRLNWTSRIGEDEVVRLEGDEEIVLIEHERTLFNTLVDFVEGSERSFHFSEVRKSFVRLLPTIYEQMGEETTQYFSMLPEKARRRWNWAGQSVVILSGVLGVLGLCGMTSMGWIACAPPVGLAVVGLMLMGVSRWMPQRTTLGIEEAARWRAFRRYLRNLKQYGDVDAAQAVLDQYFPYAVALDIEEIVLQQAETLGAQVPIWMVPAAVEVGRAAMETTRRRGLRERLPDVTGGLRMPQAEGLRPGTAKARPSLREQRPVGADLSLQGLSDTLSRSLNQASRSLSSVLNTAVGEVDDRESPFEVVVRGTGEATKMSWKAGTSTMKVLGDILEASSSGGGGGGFSGGSFRSSSWSSGGRSSGRSGGGGGSSRSGGGGRRGFG